MAFLAALRGLIDLVAPRACPGCDHDLDWGCDDEGPQL